MLALVRKRFGAFIRFNARLLAQKSRAAFTMTAFFENRQKSCLLKWQLGRRFYQKIIDESNIEKRADSMSSRGSASVVLLT